MNFRVLMQDNEMGFQFAIFVEGSNTIESETLVKYDCSEIDGARWNAEGRALSEFPDAFVIETSQVTDDQIYLN